MNEQEVICIIHTYITKITLTQHSRYKHHEKNDHFLSEKIQTTVSIAGFTCNITGVYEIPLSFCFHVKVVIAESITYEWLFLLQLEAVQSQGVKHNPIALPSTQFGYGTVGSYIFL